MAGQLKDFFDERVVRSIAEDLRAVHPSFATRAFVKESLAGLHALELTARGWHLAEALGRHLPARFADAAEILVASARLERDASAASAMEPFRFMPHTLYIAKYGLDDFEAAMAAQYVLTQRFTAEFSIRPYLEKHPALTLERLRTWATDPDVHVRRLVSEGTRPRLPWAPRLRGFQKDPSPVLALLELLKDDEERYVQRSVANNLNDIAKDHPDVAIATCRAWAKGAPPGRLWIVKHALRSLVKAGHQDALQTLGFGKTTKVVVTDPRITPSRVKLGGALRFSFAVENRGTKTAEVLVDYAVHYVKANGTTRPKVFKLKKLVLAGGERAALGGKLAVVERTTRKHHPGVHRIDVLVNGIAHAIGSFDVRPA